MVRRFVASRTLCIVAALSLPSCTHIITQSVPYYQEGPNQLAEPEGDLEAGTKAWVLGSKGSYVRVWTDSGVNAWVWDRAVMTIWDYNKAQDEDKKRREAREKWLKAQTALTAPQPANPDAADTTAPPAENPAQPTTERTPPEK